MESKEADNDADINRDSNLPSSFHAATSSSSSSSSSPDFVRNVQAAFKRHRTMPLLNNIQPRRVVFPRRETLKSSAQITDCNSSGQTKNMTTLTDANHEDASIQPPSVEQGHIRPTDAQMGQISFDDGCRSCNVIDSSVPLVDGSKKIQIAPSNSAPSQEMECDASNRVDVSTAFSQEVCHSDFHNVEGDLSSRSNDEISSLLAKRSTGVQNQIDPFSNFRQSCIGHHMTHSSVGGSSCATTTLVNTSYAPMLNSTIHCSHPSQHSSLQPMARADTENPSGVSPQYNDKIADRTTVASQLPSAAIGSCIENKHLLCMDQHGKEAGHSGLNKDLPLLGDKSTKGNQLAGDITDLQSQAPISNDQLSNVKRAPSKSGKKERAAANKDASAPRKRSYGIDLYYEVNGKPYKKLGKIGSGGSSEVHKVVTQDCTICALKKIKLKGRDYSTAYGFCQEIEYLKKLRGKDHIIQLIDYEVTDAALLEEVMSGSKCNKDGRLKEDGSICMVLEYGEIDLAQMLSQKWRELDDSKSTIDENWLRFYWQQMLLAVKTIHEERIVHSDLKPANFLLVKGSLKLIDFGIAKAIMSDTTNIQRDSQVGTLSYMSPEALLCNETDANGNTIKCGRPSDIWSLGCILYQMVYGKTPFAESATVWAKFKVITDPGHQIRYEPVSNTWLVDLMKKCLAWDRKERWTIPQLLRHPFLVPQVSPCLSVRSNLTRFVANFCREEPRATALCTRFDELVSGPLSADVTSRDEGCRLLRQVSEICLQLEEHLANSK